MVCRLRKELCAAPIHAFKETNILEGLECIYTAVPYISFTFLRGDREGMLKSFRIKHAEAQCKQ